MIPFPIKPTLISVTGVRKATGLEKDSRAAEGVAFGMSGFFITGARIAERRKA